MSRRIRTAGFSLIELMISLALGAVVTVGIIQLFSANSDTYNLLQGQSRMQESARFAFSFIGRDIREAGYMGCFSTSTDVYTTLASPNYIPYEFDLRYGVQGYDATGTNAWTPSINPLPSTVNGTDTNVYSTPAGDGTGNGIDTSKLASGSDIITLRQMSLTGYQLAQDMSGSTGDPVVGTPSNGFEFKTNYEAVIEDCEKATIFKITALTANTPAAGETTFGHAIETGNTANATMRIAKMNSFQSDAYVGAIETNTYYVAPGAGVNTSGNPIMALWRKSGLDAPVELVDGVEDMQILYGVDTNSDGAPNQYVPANFVVDWNTVKTVRVSLVVNSIDDVGGTTSPTLGCAVQGCIAGKSYDGLIRRTFTQTFDLRNRR